MSTQKRRINLLVRERSLGYRSGFAAVGLCLAAGAGYVASSSQSISGPMSGLWSQHSKAASEVMVLVQSEPKVELVTERKVEPIAVTPSNLGTQVGNRLGSVQGVVGVEPNASGSQLKVVLDSDTFFNLGTASLQERSLQAIREVALLLRETFSASDIEIEGHTDSSPVIKQRRLYPSNWELSAARAASMLHVFEEVGFLKDRLKLIALGDSRPLDEKNIGTAKDRRIVLRVVPHEAGGGR